MHDRRALRTALADVGTIRGTARTAGVSRNTVRRATRPGARDHYHRASPVDAVEPAVRDVLADYPAMAVADIAVLVDWRRSRRALSNLVARLRPEYLGRDALDVPSIDAIEAGKLLDLVELDVREVRV